MIKSWIITAVVIIIQFLLVVATNSDVVHQLIMLTLSSIAYNFNSIVTDSQGGYLHEITDTVRVVDKLELQ